MWEHASGMQCSALAHGILLGGVCAFIKGTFIKRYSYSRYDSDTDNTVPVMVAAKEGADAENTGFQTPLCGPILTSFSV